MAAKAGVEPTILRLKAIDSANAPPRPTKVDHPKTTNAAELEQLTISLSQQPSEDSMRKYGMAAEKGHILQEALKFRLFCC